MAYLESVNADKIVRQLFLHVGFGLFATELFLIYYFGRMADYWTANAKKGWRTLAIVFFALYALQVISILLQMVVIPFWTSD